MPDLELTVGGRPFLVSCQPGEEHFLRAAAAMLDAEAQPLIAAMGRLPEAKLLLMAGLMLADKTAGLEDQVRIAEARARDAEAAYERAIKNQSRVEVPVEVRVEVPVLPDSVRDVLAELADRLEGIADEVEAKAVA